MEQVNLERNHPNTYHEGGDGEQNGFIKGKSLIISLIAFYSENTGLVDERRTSLIMLLTP